jgi:hypothetical protein
MLLRNDKLAAIRYTPIEPLGSAAPNGASRGKVIGPLAQLGAC